MEADAFELAVRPLLRRGAAYAVSLLRERSEAEDAVQQTTLQAWHKRAQFDAGRSFKTWWFTILRNHCLDELRRQRRAPVAMDIEESDLSTPADESALDRHALETAMRKLPELHSEVLRLRYFGDLSYQELAQVLGIPEGTVMSRLHLARKTLAALMATEET